MNQSRSCIPLILFAVLCAPAIAFAQRGALTRPVALDQMSREASVIVRGNVISARVEPHPQLQNLTTVVISMNVAENIKGSTAKKFVYRQFIWDPRDIADSAHYLKGQELLLLLGPESKYGLRSPIGLEQGRFIITRDKAGNAKAINGAGNAGLFASVSQHATSSGVKLSTRAKSMVQKPAAGPVDLADLEDLIRSFGGAK